MNRHEEEHGIIMQSVTEALFALMEQEPFPEITVTELIRKAGIARSTYYWNFSSMEDIVKHFFRQMFADFLEKHPVSSVEDRYSKEYVENILEYLPPFREKIQILNRAGISAFYLVMLNEYLMKLYGKPRMTAVETYRIYAIAGAEYNLIFNWYLSVQYGNTTELKLFLSRLPDKYPAH